MKTLWVKCKCCYALCYTVIHSPVQYMSFIYNGNYYVANSYMCTSFIAQGVSSSHKTL